MISDHERTTRRCPECGEHLWRKHFDTGAFYDYCRTKGCAYKG